MRAERIIQASIFDMFAGHEIGRELKAMSQWLDGHPTLVGLVADDLRRRGVTETGRRGLPAELVLRCGLLKQHRQLSYEELTFHLEDSSSFRAFARLPLSWTPKKSVLHKTISAIRAETWEAINRTVLASAREEKLEPGKMVRLDSTVTAALMHEPSDSSLLWDGVRVMVRLLKAADALIGGAGVPWRDHRRAAKKRALAAADAQIAARNGSIIPPGRPTPCAPNANRCSPIERLLRQVQAAGPTLRRRTLGFGSRRMRTRSLFLAGMSATAAATPRWSSSTIWRRGYVPVQITTDGLGCFDANGKHVRIEDFDKAIANEVRRPQSRPASGRRFPAGRHTARPRLSRENLGERLACATPLTWPRTRNRPRPRA